MTRLVPAAALALLAFAAPLNAQDPRLVERFYDPGEVVRIEGKANVQTTIRFGEDELIENVAIGDSESWQVTPNKRANLLFVKPLAADAFTNMTVVTDQRTYFFDLVASAKARAVYAINFEYDPETKSQERQNAPEERASPLEMAAAKDPYAVVNPTALNFDWTSKGDKKLLPDRVYDNGEVTFLVWPAGTAVPAILVKDKDGMEGPVNFAVRGDVIVIDGVPREIILRSGKEVAALYNQQTASGATPRPAAFARRKEVTQ